MAPSNAYQLPARPRTPQGPRGFYSSSSHANAQPRLAAVAVKPEPDEEERELASIPNKTYVSPLKRGRCDSDDVEDSDAEDEQVLNETPTKRRLWRTESAAGSPLPVSSPLAGPDLSRVRRVAIQIFTDRPPPHAVVKSEPSSSPSPSASRRAVPESGPDPPSSPSPLPKRERSQQPQPNPRGGLLNAKKEEDDDYDDEDYDEEDYEDYYEDDGHDEEPSDYPYGDYDGYAGYAGYDGYSCQDGVGLKLEPEETKPPKYHPAFPDVVVRCRQCGRTDTVEEAPTAWANECNRRRAHFYCSACCGEGRKTGFICWSDALGVNRLLGLCYCRMPLREDRTTKSKPAGRRFHTCAVGRCSYHKIIDPKY